MSIPLMNRKKVEKLMVFPDNQIFNYLRSGKFEALSNEWKHESMPLLFDYEFIIVTEGTLYLKYMRNFLGHSIDGSDF